MSVIVSIDRSKLRDQILDEIILKQLLGIATDVPLVYNNGWIETSLGGARGIRIGRVNYILPPDSFEGAGLLIHFSNIVDFYPLFFETAKGIYSTFLGFRLYNNGSLRFIDNPDNINEEILPAGSITPGTYIFYLISVNGQLLSVDETCYLEWDESKQEWVEVCSPVYNICETSKGVAVKVEKVNWAKRKGETLAFACYDTPNYNYNLVTAYIEGISTTGIKIGYMGIGAYGDLGSVIARLINLLPVPS